MEHIVSAQLEDIPHPCKCVHRTLGIENCHRFTTESFVLICNSLLLWFLNLVWRPELSTRKLTGSSWIFYFATFIKGFDIKTIYTSQNPTSKLLRNEDTSQNAIRKFDNWKNSFLHFPFFRNLLNGISEFAQVRFQPLISDLVSHLVFTSEHTFIPDGMLPPWQYSCRRG